MKYKERKKVKLTNNALLLQYYNITKFNNNT